jgi:hypothetical protein
MYVSMRREWVLIMLQIVCGDAKGTTITN